MKKSTNYTTIKNKDTLQIDYKSATAWFKMLGYCLLSIYAWVESTGVNAYAIFVLLLFMVIDMILGIWKSIVIPELNPPSSKTAKRGILAKTVMLIIPVVCGLIWSVFDKNDGIKIANTMLTALMVAEGYSNITNAFSIYQKKNVEEFDAISFIFKKITEKIKKILENLFL